MGISDDHRLPEPGKIYKIPEGTHADLDLQDDKEIIFYRRNSMRRFRYFKTKR